MVHQHKPHSTGPEPVFIYNLSCILYNVNLKPVQPRISWEKALLYLLFVVEEIRCNSLQLSLLLVVVLENISIPAPTNI